ncbi:nucleoside triphosphate pyrophosphohydrolase [Bartonella sp. DGB1]|uniref:nucleoside triphosphate pyrophosphohydrolase n=1 Tax=Bartonella sp. DGB1 TaxID=3239807 RepID=UPI0035252371
MKKIKYSPALLEKLQNQIERLLDPKTGSTWCLKQDFKSLSSYTIEEAYELFQAIATNDIENIKEELGDLLFHILYYSYLSEQQNLFNFDDIVKDISEKLTRRNPHIFNKNSLALENDLNKYSWQEIKNQEKLEKNLDKTDIFIDISNKLSPIQQAKKLQNKAKEFNIDWNSVDPIINKVKEELIELTQAIETDNIQDIENELGDIFFILIKLSQYLSIDPEHALNKANNKFRYRLNYINSALKNSNKNFDTATLAELEELWCKAKTSLSSS